MLWMHTLWTGVLSQDEQATIKRIAAATVKNNEEERYIHHAGTPESRALELMEVGLGAEYFIAKTVGLPWEFEIGNRSKPDVGPYQVRCRTKAWMDLLIDEIDKPDGIYILVHARPEWGMYTAAGWTWGHVAKQPRYWKKVGSLKESYMLRRNELAGMQTLPHWGLVETIKRVSVYADKDTR